MASTKTHLLQDHQELERLLGRLHDAVDGADAPTIQRIWGEFEARLSRHLQTEERYLLPLVEGRYPDEARTIRGEHADIRRRVEKLGVECDLHLLRKDSVNALIDKLRQHAAGEDRHFYRLLSELSPRPMVSRLKTAVTEVLTRSRRAAREGPRPGVS